MNLGGIKVSSAEIEQVLQSVPGVFETAAIAVASDGGPSQLVIYAVCPRSHIGDKETMAAAMQGAIKRDLNPLFKIHDLVLIEALPRTASNKIMRRELRAQYAMRPWPIIHFGPRLLAALPQPKRVHEIHGTHENGGDETTKYTNYTKGRGPRIAPIAVSTRFACSRP